MITMHGNSDSMGDMMRDSEETVKPDSTHPYLPGLGPLTPLLRVLHGQLAGREYVLTTEESSIGRDPHSDIIIDEMTVSRHHATIVQKVNEYLLSDLKSANGVFMNNLKIERAVLRNGDVFQIGSCVFQFVWNRSTKPV
jgi:pSer/pThr/pTyr-binding forkhead associated (FHA) protein